jgi:antitoxin component HigA of HigAB toxin-antitoxin module
MAQMGLTLDAAKHGKLLAKELPHRVRNDAEYDKWAAQLERIDFEGGSAEELEYAELLRVLLDLYDGETAESGTPVQALQLLMDERGISKAELGRRLNVTRAQATNLANGQRFITRETADRLAKIFHVRPQTFWD